MTVSTDEVERSLQEALAWRAAAASTSPHACSLISQRRGVPRGAARRLVLGAAALTTLAVLAATGIGRHGGHDAQLRTLATPARPTAFSATVLGDGLARSPVEGVGPDVGPITVQAFVRPGPHQVPTASIAIFSTRDPGAGARLFGSVHGIGAVRLRTTSGTASRTSRGLSIISWAPASGSEVWVVGRDADDTQLHSVAEQVSVDPGSQVARLSADRAPAGYRAAYDGPLPRWNATRASATESDYTRDSFDAGVAVITYSGPAVSIDMVSWMLAGGRATTVRGHPGIEATGYFTDLPHAGEDHLLAWAEQPGVVIQMASHDVPAADVRSIAEGLQASARG